MRRSDFEYNLPEKMIAQVPLLDRTAARLLVLDRQTGQIAHSHFNRLQEFLKAGDLLVLNDTKVRKCRLRGERLPSGGKVEIFLLNKRGEDLYEAMAKPARRLRPGTRLSFGDGRLFADVVERTPDRFIVSLSTSSDEPTDDVLEQVAEMPLPPYIKRPGGPDKQDERLYQTVYSEVLGAVAAPTAGLHFEKVFIEHLEKIGIEFTYVTVHTGLGSFKPIRSENIEDHEMPAEEFSISEKTAIAINSAKKMKRRVVAVGTSCVRALETVAKESKLIPQTGKTSLYITPGHDFKMVDCMVTNFHQPASSLIVLVSAFAGRQTILEAYREAIERGYRFFSYGDAMLIL
ncbi:tRNA preQ1(34) S-adenosylmethionine ribosyltransferase-isomerase QueA [bacterium]|nr:tRNA preQ1(34) S-adenosylmethionine ribosyltransferase-isomerase QueA [bacterium]